MENYNTRQKEEKNSEAQSKNFSDCRLDRGALQLHAADRDDEIKRERKDHSAGRRQPDPRRNCIAEQGLYHR